MIQALVDLFSNLIVIAALALMVIVGFIALCIRIKIVDSRAKKARKARAKQKARMTLITEDGREVDMTPYIRDISFGTETPQPPDWGRRLVGSPDGAVTIEMETIVTEEDHGTSHDGGDPRAREAD